MLIMILFSASTEPCAPSVPTCAQDVPTQFDQAYQQYRLAILEKRRAERNLIKGDKELIKTIRSSGPPEMERLIAERIGPAYINDIHAAVSLLELRIAANHIQEPTESHPALPKKIDLEKKSFGLQVGELVNELNGYVTKIRTEVQRTLDDPSNNNFYLPQSYSKAPFNIAGCALTDAQWAAQIATLQLMYHVLLLKVPELHTILRDFITSHDEIPFKYETVIPKIQALLTSEGVEILATNIDPAVILQHILIDLYQINLYLENCTYLRINLLDLLRPFPTLRETLENEKILCKVFVPKVCSLEKGFRSSKTGSAGSWYLVKFLDHRAQLCELLDIKNPKQILVEYRLSTTQAKKKLTGWAEKLERVHNNSGPKTSFVEAPRYDTRTPPPTREEIEMRAAERRKKWIEHFRQLEDEPVQPVDSPTNERYVPPTIPEPKRRPKAELTREIARLMTLGELVDPTLETLCEGSPVDTEAEIQEAMGHDPWGQWIEERINKGPLTSLDLRLIANHFHLGLVDNEVGEDTDRPNVDMRVKQTKNGVMFSYTINGERKNFAIHKQHGNRSEGFVVVAKNDFLEFLWTALETHYRYAR